MIDTRTNTGKAAFTGALAAVVVGACVLAGWLFDLEFLKRIAPGFVAMNPATAVAFILAGASLALFLRSPHGRDQRSRALILTARLCALVVTLIGLARLAGILSGWNPGVDQWLFASKLSDGLPFPNRIAPNTALGFLLFGSALLFVDVKNKSVRFCVECSVVMVGFGSLLAVLAYAYDIQSFYGLSAFIPMALHTAISFSVLVVALLLSHTDSGLLAVFAGDSAGGKMARRLLPAAVLVPAVFGWLTRQGEKAGLYHGGFSDAAFAVANILVFTFLVCWSAKELFSADLVRKKAEEALEESEARTRLLVKSSNIGLWDWNLVTNEVFFSPDWKNQLGYSDTELPSRFEEWESRLHPEDREPTLAAVKDYCDGRRANYEVEFRLRHKDGSWRWILTRASLTRNAIGQPVRIMGGHIDITERKQAEEALRESEERFSGAFLHAPIGVALVSSDGRYLKVNKALCALIGYSEAELLTRRFHDITHPEDIEADLENARALIAGKIHSYQMEKRYVHKRGHFVTALLDVSLIRDEQNQPRYYISQVQDITERKRVEGALRDSEEKYRRLFDSSKDAFMTLAPPDWRFTSGNPSTIATFRARDEAEFVSKAPWELSPERQPDGRLSAEKAKAMIEQAMREGNHYFEWTHKRLDGEEFPATVLLTRLELKGRVLLNACVRDITERRRAEESLRLLSSAVEQAKESIIITDAELDQPAPKILFVNPAFTRMTGYTAEEAIGKTPQLLEGPCSDKAVFIRLVQSLKRGEAFEAEVINYRKDGSEFDVELHIAPLRNAGGKITHFVAIQHDITERKRSEAELEKVHKELLEASRQAGMAEFATGVLHNVGNVLNSVNVASSCVADSLRKSKAANLSKVAALLRAHEKDLGGFFTNDPKARQVPVYLEQLAKHLAGEQAAALNDLAELRKNIEHIKEIVTMQQGFAKASGVTETVNVTELVEDALRMNLSRLARHDIEVIKEFKDTPLVTVEKHKVLQILVNLVRNAKHACEASDLHDRKLTIRTTNGEDRVRIAVCDNGVGILPENLIRIFSHGFTTKKDGHGFGLHSGANAAKEMGGSLTVQSDGPGQGATFTLHLPVQPKSTTQVLEK